MDIRDLTQRHESNMRAKAFVARAVGAALYDSGWEQHVELVAGRTFIPELKAPVAAGTRYDPVFAGPLAETRLFSSGFIELVRPFTVLDRLVGARRAPMNVRLPRETSDSVPEFDWVGEMEPAPVAAFSFDTVELPVARVSGITVFTRDLATRPDAQSFIEASLVRAVARGTDNVALDPSRAAVTGRNPASLTHDALTVPSTGSDSTSVESDVAAMFLLLSGGEPLRPYAVMSANTAMRFATMRSSNGERTFPGVSITGGDLLGAEILISPSAQNYVIAVDSDGVVIADAGVELVPAMNTSLQMSDSPVGGAAPLFSMFMANTVAVRATRFVSWTRRADAVVTLALAFGSPE